MTQKIKLSENAIVQIYGQSRVKGNNLIKEIAMLLDKSNQTIWRYIRQNQWNGPFTTNAVASLLEKNLTGELFVIEEKRFNKEGEYETP